MIVRGALRVLTTLLTGVVLAASRPLLGQAPATPLSAAANATVPDRTLVTLSVESGYYRHRVHGVIPVAAHAVVERNNLAVSAGYGRLFSTAQNEVDGKGVGLGLGVQLWSPGAALTSPGGRFVTAVQFSSFDDPGITRRQIDLPLALAFTHKLPPPGFTALPWLAPRFQPRMVDDGDGTEWDWLLGLSGLFEIVKSVCEPGTDCVIGWGFKVGAEVMASVEGNPLEWGVTGGFLWKFF